MNVKELVQLMKQKKYVEFCNACEEISPRALHYLCDAAGSGVLGEFQDELYEKVSAEQFSRWRYLFSFEAEVEYIKKHNANLYKLSPEEKRQACLA